MHTKPESNLVVRDLGYPYPRNRKGRKRNGERERSMSKAEKIGPQYFLHFPVGNWMRETFPPRLPIFSHFIYHLYLDVHWTPFQKISILERANNDLLSLSPNFRVQVNFWPKLRLEDVGISDKLVRNPPTGCKLLFLVGQYPCRMEVELEQKDLNQTRSKNMMREVQMIYSTKRSRPALEQHCSLFFLLHQGFSKHLRNKSSQQRLSSILEENQKATRRLLHLLFRP